MNGRLLLFFPFTLIFLILAGCGNNLEADLNTYEEDTEKIIELNNEFNDTVNKMDFDKLQSMYYEDADEDLEYLHDLQAQVDETLVPLTEELVKENEAIEIDNEELQEVHNILQESINVKHDFTTQMASFLDAYVLSIDSNSQLVSLSKSFITHQKERDDIIESAESAEEIEEMNALIDVLNQNSEALDEHTNAFQNKKNVEDKEEYGNDELIPLIDDHIASLNALNISTDKATRARTISLEMYYNYRTYFEERKNVMASVENLQAVSLENLLPLAETAATLDSQYADELETKKNEAR